MKQTLLGSLKVFLNLKYPINYRSSGCIHNQPCQENQPKSLQHNTLNKSRHRKETAQSLFMAELQCLSSKQQILLNLYHVSDEQKREKERATRRWRRLCEHGEFSRKEIKSRHFLHQLQLIKQSFNSAKKICLVPRSILSLVSAPNNLMSESNPFTLFN